MPDYAQQRGHRITETDNASHRRDRKPQPTDRPETTPSASLCTRSLSSSASSLLRPPLARRLFLLHLELRTFSERFRPPRALFGRRLGRRRQPAESLARFRQRRGGRRRRRCRGSRRRFGRIAVEGGALLLWEGTLLDERLCRAGRQRRLKLFPRIYGNESCVSESQTSPSSRADSLVGAVEDAVT